ncbi:MAG: filamentous hemagglutinin N-terminal domain-containing protein [Methylococcaceae bacterium]
MKAVIRALFYCIPLLCGTVNAQVITDGSMGAVKHLSGKIFIPQALGTTAGQNLFHSFKTFNINQNESVTFTGSNDLKNVISRVTGGEISQLNGVLKSDIAHANFYFINPAGVFFGEGAKVDVPAAFHISTSDSLYFKDGQSFLAALNKSSQLSIAEPANFGFLSNQAGDITIHNTGIYKSEFDKNSNYLGTHCQGDCFYIINHNDVLFNANNINFESGILLNYAGSVSLKANNIHLNHFSSIDTSTDDFRNAGDITMNAINIALKSSNIFSNANQKSTGHAGLINLQASQLFLIDAQGISGNAGIFGRTYSIGHAGTALLKSAKIISENGAVLSVSTLGKGRGGDITIESGELIVDNGSISSNSNVAALGNAGNIDITSDKLTVKNEGYINSTTFGVANAGTVTVQAKDLILSNGSIYSNARASGHGGAIMVTSDNISIEKGGKINSSSYGAGNAGNVFVSANNISIAGSSFLNTNPLILKYANISALASESSTAQAGNVTVTANHSLYLDNGGYISVENDTTVNHPQLIKPSVLSVSAADITLENNSAITTQSKGNTNAGHLKLAFSHLLEVNNASITTQAKTGDGGSLIIKGGELINLSHSDIYTATDSKQETIKGGDVKITANVLLMNDARIIAKANKSNGGYADLYLKAIIPSENQLQINGQTSNSFESIGAPLNFIKTANSGWTTPQLNLSGSISTLNRNTLEVPDLNRDSCNDASLQNSSLVRGSRGGIASNETEFVIMPLNLAFLESSDLLATDSDIINYPCSALSSSGALFVK